MGETDGASTLLPSSTGTSSASSTGATSPRSSSSTDVGPWESGMLPECSSDNTVFGENFLFRVKVNRNVKCEEVLRRIAQEEAQAQYQRNFYSIIRSSLGAGSTMSRLTERLQDQIQFPLALEIQDPGVRRNRCVWSIGLSAERKDFAEVVTGGGDVVQFYLQEPAEAERVASKLLRECMGSAGLKDCMSQVYGVNVGTETENEYSHTLRVLKNREVQYVTPAEEEADTPMRGEDDSDLALTPMPLGPDRARLLNELVSRMKPRVSRRSGERRGIRLSATPAQQLWASLAFAHGGCMGRGSNKRTQLLHDIRTSDNQVAGAISLIQLIGSRVFDLHYFEAGEALLQKILPEKRGRDGSSDEDLSGLMENLKKLRVGDRGGGGSPQGGKAAGKATGKAAGKAAGKGPAAPAPGKSKGKGGEVEAVRPKVMPIAERIPLFVEALSGTLAVALVIKLAYVAYVNLCGNGANAALELTPNSDNGMALVLNVVLAALTADLSYPPGRISSAELATAVRAATNVKMDSPVLAATNMFILPSDSRMRTVAFDSSGREEISPVKPAEPVVDQLAELLRGSSRDVVSAARVLLTWGDPAGAVKSDLHVHFAEALANKLQHLVRVTSLVSNDNNFAYTRRAPALTDNICAAADFSENPANRLPSAAKLKYAPFEAGCKAALAKSLEVAKRQAISRSGKGGDLLRRPATARPTPSLILAFYDVKPANLPEKLIWSTQVSATKIDSALQRGRGGGVLLPATIIQHLVLNFANSVRHPLQDYGAGVTIALAKLNENRARLAEFAEGVIKKIGFPPVDSNISGAVASERLWRPVLSGVMAVKSIAESAPEQNQKVNSLISGAETEKPQWDSDVKKPLLEGFAEWAKNDELLRSFVGRFSPRSDAVGEGDLRPEMIECLSVAAALNKYAERTENPHSGRERSPARFGPPADEPMSPRANRPTHARAVPPVWNRRHGLQ